MKGQYNHLWFENSKMQLGLGERRAAFKTDTVISEQKLTEYAFLNLGKW